MKQRPLFLKTGDVDQPIALYKSFYSSLWSRMEENKELGA